MISFKHSGSAGDVIYSLPIIKHLGGGKLFLSCDINDFLELQKVADPRTHPLNPYKLDGTLGVFVPSICEFIIPLLKNQPYIKDCLIWTSEIIDLDLNIWRASDIKFFSTNLTDCHAIGAKCQLGLGNSKWLHVTPIKKFKTIFARSMRHRENNFPWKNYLRAFPEAIFTGIEEEHKDFVKNFGYIPLYKSPNALELAQVIGGCELFIGNQSLPYALAEGLKINRIQETSLLIPNCIFQNQSNALYGSSAYYAKML